MADVLHASHKLFANKESNVPLQDPNRRQKNSLVTLFSKKIAKHIFSKGIWGADSVLRAEAGCQTFNLKILPVYL